MERKALIRKYTEEFPEKVFYFCLKKCGNPEQAEDLAGEINLCVLTELDRGAVPQSFNAWVWAIARNRYSRWAAGARLHRETVLPQGIEEYEIPDGDSVEQRVISSEQLQILRRELAFITREYREILIAYYIDGRKTGEIAETLGVPKGTVLSKLHRIRKKLKEGFEMSREFGVLSYKPEEIGFVMNGMQGHDGAPWCYLKRTLAKNALLAAYKNPTTADELAIEMGIALPYMEDELENLVRSTLMKKSGDKYETAIFIVSARAQERCYNYLASIAPELTEHLIRTIEYQTACLDENGSRWHEGYQAFEDMKWALMMRLVDGLCFRLPSRQAINPHPANIGYMGHMLRPASGQWDLIGLESCDTERPAFIGLHGLGETPDMSGSGHNYQFGQFKFFYEDIASRTPMQLSETQCRTIVSCVRNEENQPPEIIAELEKFGYLIKENGSYRPTFWVMLTENLKSSASHFSEFSGELTDGQKAQYAKVSAPAIELLDSLYRECREAIMQEVPAFLRDDEYQIAHTIRNIMFPREQVLMEALSRGWLTYDKNDPESAKRRMLGAYLII